MAEDNQDGNQDQQDAGNSDHQGDQGQDVQQQDVGSPKYYEKFESDLKTHPAIQKFETPEALAKGYVDLEKVFGGEKLVNPFKLEGEKRKIGMKAFNEATGVPADASGYDLPDVEGLPEGVDLGKETFAQAMLEQGIRPEQAKALWEKYGGDVSKSYAAQAEAYQTNLNASETALRKDWGEKYDSNLQVIGKVIGHKLGSEGKADFEHVNEVVSKDPVMMRLMEKFARDYSENQIGGFSAQQSKMTPQEAQAEYDSIVANMSDPYYSDVKSVRLQRMSYVDDLCKMGASPGKIG